MRYLRTRIAQFVVVFISMNLFVSSCCGKEKTSSEESTISYSVSDTDSLYNNFNNIYGSDTHKKFYEISSLLKLKQSLELDVDIEIRILSSRDFKDYFLYRFSYKEGYWKGEVYTIEYMTLELKDSKSFKPVKGWESFERSLMYCDLLNIHDYRSNQNYLHPRTFDLQILTRNYMKVISLEDFYNSKDKKSTSYIQIESLIKSIFGDDYLIKLEG